MTFGIVLMSSKVESHWSFEEYKYSRLSVMSSKQLAVEGTHYWYAEMQKWISPLSLSIEANEDNHGARETKTLNVSTLLYLRA